MLDRIKLLRYERPITLLALSLITIFIIGGFVFGVYKLFFEEKAVLPIVGETGDKIESIDVTETAITKETIRTPDELEGVKITNEDLEAANASMNDEGAYEGSYDENVIPDNENLYMEGAAEDPYLNDNPEGEAIGVYGAKSEAETIKMIRDRINSAPGEAWLGRDLTDKEKDILAKIKSDPKNCYPEFNSAGNFNYTMQGYALSFYLNFITNVLMCGGDINNYDCGIY